MDFYNDFLKYKMSQFTGLKGHYLLLSKKTIEVESKQIVSTNSELSHSSQSVVTYAILAKLMTYHWRRKKIIASVAGS